MWARALLGTLLTVGLFLLPACRKEKSAVGGEAKVAFSLTSAAFKDGERIPTKYTCRGEDVSPPLSWSGAPEGTKAFALIVEDPDAPRGTFIHWVIYNIPGETKGLPEGVLPREKLEDGTLQGVNDFRTIGYRGPCPPPGKPHHYVFILWALDEKLALDPGATAAELKAAIKDHVLAEARLTGLFSR